MFQVQNEEPTEYIFKKRKVTETESLEILDGDELFKKNLFELDSILQICEEKDLNKNVKERLLEFYEKIKKNTENITYESMKKDVLKENSFLSAVEKVVKVVKESMKTLEEIKEEKKEEFKLETNNQKSIIDMSAQEILLVFVGKNDGMEDKQEETNNFLTKFLDLQKIYKEEAELLNQSKKEWIEKYEKMFQNHSKVRNVTQIEQDTVFKEVESKMNKILSMLKDKYLSKVFSLQENVLMKAKKRGNLPKSAINVLKNWLYQHFLHPYPTEDEKRDISRQTNLTITQINNWFINARVRTWRPMLENMLEGERDKKGPKVDERQINTQTHPQNQLQMNGFWNPPNYPQQMQKQEIQESFDFPSTYVHPTGIIPSWVTSKRYETGDDSHLEDE